MRFLRKNVNWISNLSFEQYAEKSTLIFINSFKELMLISREFFYHEKSFFIYPRNKKI